MKTLEGSHAVWVVLKSNETVTTELVLGKPLDDDFSEYEFFHAVWVEHSRGQDWYMCQKLGADGTGRYEYWVSCEQFDWSMERI